MTQYRRAWLAWVNAWNDREAPWGIALVRIGLALCLLWDLSWVGIERLVVPLWAPIQAGGWGDVLSRGDVPFVWRVLPPTAESAWAIWGTLMVSIAFVGLGILPRLSTIVFVLLYAQTASIMDDADRGIDTMMRNVLLILWWSPAWEVLSLRAWWRSGSFLGDGAHHPAWARQLLVLQLVVMYFGAGITKTGLGWMPWGGFTALYYILHDPAVARFDLGRSLDPLYFLTQFGSAITILWEYTSPLMLLFFWIREKPTALGRFRDFCLRWHPERLYVVVGAAFHILIAAGLNLGIFPFAMLAMYPAFAAPWAWNTWFKWLPGTPNPAPQIADVG